MREDPPFFHATRRRGRKGVSEIVGSLVLILITSVTGALLYSYSLGSFTSAASSFAIQAESDGKRSQERMSITAVWWNGADQLNVTVLNSGDIEISMDAFYVNGVMATDYASGRSLRTIKGSLVSVKFVSPVTMTLGQTYEVLGVTERGSTNVISWKA